MRRVRVAQALAFVALIASAVGALGPADRVRSTYSWPPSPLPQGSPSKLWYTPLLLIRHVPESIVATVPCSLPPALRDAERPPTVLATARYPERAGGLSLRQIGDDLVVAVGEKVVDRVGLEPGSTGSGSGARTCAYLVRLAENTWSIEGGPRGIAHGGALESLPNVTGLFSALDLRADSRPTVSVTTAVHATPVTTRQTIAWTVAALSVVAALLLLGFAGTTRLRRATLMGPLRSAIAHLHPVDAVVAIVLIGWVVLGPAYWDDGWIIARERMFAVSGGFSNYYEAFGGNLPLDYWLEWVQHWWTETSSHLVLLRLPSLLCLSATWILCRWIFSRVQASTRSASGIAIWTLASGYLVGALAWGMTLRPEPVTALSVTAVMACMIRFLERGTVAPVVLVAVLVPMAVTAHPAGVVSLAAVVVATPQLFRWARERFAVVTAILASACALTATLAFVGSDLQQRRLDTQTARSFGVSAEFTRDEVVRYALLAQEPSGTPLRRASIALIGLVALAFVFRRRRQGRSLLDFPAPVAMAGLLLLLMTPSKWPMHFGTLMGVAAVAMAAEAVRLRNEGARASGWSTWPFLAIVATTLAAAWSWWERTHWNVADLRTLEWNRAFGAAPLQLIVLLPLLLLGVVSAVAIARGRRRELPAVPWRVLSWTAPVFAVPLIAFTAGTLIADSLDTGSWTLGRQNARAITGDAGCGLGDDVLVPARSSVRALTPALPERAVTTPMWVPRAPVPSLSRFALGPLGRGSGQSPWFALPAGKRIGIYVSGTPGRFDTLAVEWGLMHGQRIETLATDQVADLFDTVSPLASWRFLSAADLPRPELRASVVRVTLRTDAAPGAPLAVTSPVSYDSERLSSRMSPPHARTLVAPDLLTYFPCTRLPLLRGGTVEVPDHIVLPDRPYTLLRDAVSSPFFGLPDLYEIPNLPIADMEHPPDRVLVFEVDRRIPGARLAPPVETTVTS